MKVYIYMLIVFFPGYLFGQQWTGKIIDENGKAIENINLILFPAEKGYSTDLHGNFAIDITNQHKLLVSGIGYESLEIQLDGFKLSAVIVLKRKVNQIEEVIVNTGYVQSSRERLTGSFELIDQSLVQRNPSANILERLEGITGSLQFDRSSSDKEYFTTPTLRLRGLASLESATQPLIILDNFPYDGDINSINPNDVESITVLKDAAAASIWGARAGNGVIVLTSKKGSKYQKIRLTYNTNIALSPKPDLFYNRNFISSKDLIAVEDRLYRQNFYSQFDHVQVPDYVSLLFNLKDNKITLKEFESKKNQLERIDFRDEARKHLYQQAFNQRHYLQVRGGEDRHSFLISGSLDKNKATIIGNRDNRYTLRVFNEIKVIPALTLSADIRYSQMSRHNNGYTLDQLSKGTYQLAPYTRFYDDSGELESLNYQYLRGYVEHAPANGFLNWSFNPINNRGKQDLKSIVKNLLFAGGLHYKLNPYLSFDFKYQYQQEHTENSNFYEKDSYYVRDLVNQFMQPDGSRPIPTGAIKDGYGIDNIFHNGRVQVNYNREWNTLHQFSFLSGAELRQNQQMTKVGYQIYGFNSDNMTGQNLFDYTKYYLTNPLSFSQIKGPPSWEGLITDRFLSYFSNFSYGFKNRHFLSASARWDASNLYGVKTNQKGVPLWSVGLSENLYPILEHRFNWLSKLGVRMTYGLAGNTNNSMSTFPTVLHLNSDFYTKLPAAMLLTIGNPSLKWEQVQTINLGLDFGFWKNRVGGSIEYYQKNGKDLIGGTYLDPTTGINIIGGRFQLDNRINYANLKTTGIDLQINTLLIDRGFKWRANLILSYVSNKVTRYNANAMMYATAFLSDPKPIVGQSLDQLYAWKFEGLNPDNGFLMTPNGDQNYSAYVNGANIDDLLLMGLDFPPYQGSIRNTFAFRNLELTANVQWKNGFKFRRNSINYSQLFNNGLGNVDYTQRWQKSGDENKTHVPALPNDVDIERDFLYTYSNLMIESGDYIRLSDLRFSYNLALNKANAKQLNAFVHVNNVGFLYRKNKLGIDPDLPYASYPTARTYTVGFQLEW